MLPAMSINYLAVLACAVAAMTAGFLWFGPLFGKTWARHMGFANVEANSGSMGIPVTAIFSRASPSLASTSTFSARETK